MLALSGCTRTTINYSVMPIDPPIQPMDERDCIQLGYDGLACRDLGMKI